MALAVFLIQLFKAKRELVGTAAADYGGAWCNLKNFWRITTFWIPNGDDCDDVHAMKYPVGHWLWWCIDGECQDCPPQDCWRWSMMMIVMIYKYGKYPVGDLHDLHEKYPPAGDEAWKEEQGYHVKAGPAQRGGEDKITITMWIFKYKSTNNNMNMKIPITIWIWKYQ